MLLVMCRKIEAVSIFRIIKTIDPHAFVSQSHVNGVYGQGFDEEKMKQHIKKEKKLKGTSGSADGKPSIIETTDFSQRHI